MRIPRVLISSPSSSSGKTTVVCALLQVLMNRYRKCSAGSFPVSDSLFKNPPAAVKCGPDFIDPLFHQTIIGAKTGNVDLFFTPGQKARDIFAHDTNNCSIAVCEGAMGYYDGLGAVSDTSSSYDAAQKLGCPVIFVVDVKGRSLSVCAEINGYLSFKEKSGICAVILNRCAKSLYEKLAPVIERECGVTVLGYVEPNKNFTIESRHLGLVTPDAVSGLKEKIALLSSSFEKTVDVEKIIKIAESAPDLPVGAEWPANKEKNTDSPAEKKSADSVKRTRIAVAHDSSFCFYYRENFDLLESLGADIVTFSPLKNEQVPENCSALYIGGGYPELFPAELSSNEITAQSIRTFARSGAPVYAECGGFLYLQIIGILPGTFSNTGHLVRFGYCTLTADCDTILCKKGESIRAHEFHYFDTTDNGDSFTAKKSFDDVSWKCIKSCAPVSVIHAPPCGKKSADKKNILAGFPHLYFPANESFAENFVRAAKEFSQSESKSSCKNNKTSCSGNCSLCGSCSSCNSTVVHGACSAGQSTEQQTLCAEKSERAELSLSQLISSVQNADESYADLCKQRWNSIAKPLGSLGVLEDDICRIAAVQRTVHPSVSKRALAIFCADNGIVAENVTQTGQNVTAIVAKNICTGATSSCCMAHVAKCDVYPVDMGMVSAVDDSKIIDLHVARGTKDFLKESAMSREQAELAVKNGFDFAQSLAERGYTLLATGEMGIGNTTTSSAVVSVLLGIDPVKVTGPGAGLSKDGVMHKIDVIKKGIAFLNPDKNDALDVVAKVGGFDIAGMAGFFIGGASAHVPVIIDGFISAAAALVAVRICPSCRGALVASHVSSEKAGHIVLDSLGLKPAVTAGMHLGEGTGCMTLIPMIDMALSVYEEMATFDDIKIGAYKPL